jgi:hypothetical protein
MTPARSMTKTRSFACVAIVGIVTMAACAKAPAKSGGRAAIPHPEGSQQVVLRISDEGGFVSSQVLQLRVPQFSLFGDGTVVTVGPQIDIYPGPALPSVLSNRLTEDGVQSVLEAALGAGLGQQRSDLTGPGSVGVSDMATTVFTFDANGATTSLKVYALGAGRSPGMSEDEYKVRRQLQSLVTKLSTLEQWMPQGSVTATQPFEGTGTLVYVSNYRPQPQLREPEIAWPLAAPLETFGETTAGANMGATQRCGTVTGADWTQKLRPLAAKANQLSPWTSAGFRYELAFRPLLPDETTC